MTVYFGFLSFSKNMSKNIDKNISKKLGGKYSQKLPDHPKHSAIDVFKTVSKRTIQKTNGVLIGNKNADKTKKIQEPHHRIV